MILAMLIKAPANVVPNELALKNTCMHHACVHFCTLYGCSAVPVLWNVTYFKLGYRCIYDSTCTIRKGNLHPLDPHMAVECMCIGNRMEGSQGFHMHVRCVALC